MSCQVGVWAPSYPILMNQLRACRTLVDIRDTEVDELEHQIRDANANPSSLKSLVEQVTLLRSSMLAIQDSTSRQIDGFRTLTDKMAAQDRKLTSLMTVPDVIVRIENSHNGNTDAIRMLCWQMRNSLNRDVAMLKILSELAAVMRAETSSEPQTFPVEPTNPNKEATANDAAQGRLAKDCQDDKSEDSDSEMTALLYEIKAELPLSPEASLRLWRKMERILGSGAVHEKPASVQNVAPPVALLPKAVEQGPANGQNASDWETRTLVVVNPLLYICWVIVVLVVLIVIGASALHRATREAGLGI